MEHLFRERYGQKLPIAIVPSTIQLLSIDLPSSEPSCSERRTAADPFCIGHLTNLQLAKGLDLVLDVLRALRRQGRNVRLILAGPADTNVERKLIESARTEFGSLLDYRGPIYGSDKGRFFDDIQAKVYPTRNDAQPLVIMESFARGKPVVSYGRGCIPGMLPKPEWSIRPDADFVPHAVRQIERWIDDPEVYHSDCLLARKTFDAGTIEARIALDRFIQWICLQPDSDFVRRGEESSVPAIVTPA